MIRMHLKSVLPVVTAIAAGAVTLASPSTASAAVPQGRADAVLHATSQHRIIAPAALRPGLIHLRNTGRAPVAVFAKESASIDVLIKDLNHQDARHGRDLFSKFDLVDLLAPRRDGYAYLRRGTYYVVDVSARRFGPARVRTVTVSGARRDARTPTSGRLTVGRGGRLSGTPTGNHHEYLRFVNNSRTPRTLMMIGVARSTTHAQVRAFLAHPSYDRMYALSSQPFLVPTIIGAGRSVIVHLIAPDRRYFAFTAGLGNTDQRLLAGQVRLLTLGRLG